MDAVLCLREAARFQSMELERPEAICGLIQAYDRGYGPPEDIVTVVGRQTESDPRCR